MYAVQLRLIPSQRTAATPSPDDLTDISTRARDAFADLEHIRIRTGAEDILLTMFIAADSSTGAAATSLVIARHIVATETAVRGWRCAADSAA